MPARAEIGIEREEWRVVGWNDACSVAFVHLGYPKFGEAIHGEPVITRVGTLTIPAGKEKAAQTLTLDASGTNTWDSKGLAAAEKELKKAGYDRPGFIEDIRRARVGEQPGLEDRLSDLKTLAPRAPVGGKGLRWAAAAYSPLSTCALLVFEREDEPARLKLELARVYNPRVRRERGYDHASNARLLFESGDLDGGLAEAKTAAAVAPELPIARYNHAAMLCLSGRLNEAVAELSAAIKLDARLIDKAKTDWDLDNLRKRQDFRELMRLKPSK